MLPLLLCVLLDEPRVEPKGKAELRLEFSSKSYDPLKPGKETVKGVLVNNTGKPIKVPMFYDGRAVQLVARDREKGVSGWDLKLFYRSVVRKTVEVKPAGRHVLFELKLADIMRVKREGRALYGWDWSARPQSPPSPAVDRRGNVLPGKVKFVLRLMADGVGAESPPAELEFVVGKK